MNSSNNNLTLLSFLTFWSEAVDFIEEYTIFRYNKYITKCNNNY